MTHTFGRATLGRRSFLGALAGALLSGPVAAAAQQATGMPRIGYLSLSSPTVDAYPVEAFRRGLRDLGYIEGQNIGVDYRWADGDDARVRDQAADLVRLRLDVIVAFGTSATGAAMQATKTIPIVIASSSDPVRGRLVASLARPGGNVTGFSALRTELEGKRLELFKQAVPSLSRVAVLLDEINPMSPHLHQEVNVAARASHVTLQPVVKPRGIDELERAFAAISTARPQGLFVGTGRALSVHRGRIVDFAAKSRLPTIYPYREYVDAGGLMSYGANYGDLFRGAALYVDKILRGAKPADLPVQQSTRFDLVINLKTAKALGLTIPSSLMQRADEVIQ